MIEGDSREGMCGPVLNCELEQTLLACSEPWCEPPREAKGATTAISAQQRTSGATARRSEGEEQCCGLYWKDSGSLD